MAKFEEPKLIAMKLFLILMTSMVFTIPGAIAQFDMKKLDGNNTGANILNNGVFMSDTSLRPGLEFPNGNNSYLIFTNSFWFAADEGTRVAAQLYNPDLDDPDGFTNRDFFQGAITTGTATAPDEPYAKEIYVISREEILDHAANYAVWDYEIPDVIANWPAHGDMALGLDYQLAPFADLNANEIYEPELGEYPEIRGDYAAYVILNDVGGFHTCSGADPLGIEIHFMFYQYESMDPILDNTTFLHMKVFNRGTTNYDDFIAGNFADFDIGDSNNDFVGCNVENNVIFGYNGWLNDDGAGGQTPYGDNPPACGIVGLNHTMNVAGYFERGAGPYADPNSGMDYWNYLNGKWKNGLEFQYGGNGHTTGTGEPYRYMFDGYPTSTDEEEWNELNSDNPAGDRRMFMASEQMTLNGGDVRCFDYAYIAYDEAGHAFENASGLIEMAGEVQEFYNDQPNTYCDFTLDIPDYEKEEEILVYPNPSNGTFTVDGEGYFDIEIYDPVGRLVFSEIKQASGQQIATGLSAGSYLMIITRNTMRYRSSIIIE